MSGGNGDVLALDEGAKRIEKVFDPPARSALHEHHRRLASAEQRIAENEAVDDEQTREFAKDHSTLVRLHGDVIEAVDRHGTLLREHGEKIDALDERVGRFVDHSTNALRTLTDATTKIASDMDAGFRSLGATSADMRPKLDSLAEVDDAHALELQRLRDEDARKTETISTLKAAVDRHDKMLAFRIGAAITTAIPIIIAVWEYAKKVFGK